MTLMLLASTIIYIFFLANGYKADCVRLVICIARETIASEFKSLDHYFDDIAVDF